MQSEYMALSEASREAIAHAQFFEELNIPSPPVVILSDNQAALDLADGTTNHRKSKHINIRYHQGCHSSKKERWKSAILRMKIKSLISSPKLWVHNGINAWFN